MQTNEREEVNLFFTGNSNAVKITDRVRMCQFVLSGVSKQPLKFDRYYVKLRFFLSVFEINQPHRNKGRFFLMKAAHHDSLFFCFLLFLLCSLENRFHALEHERCWNILRLKRVQIELHFDGDHSRSDQNQFCPTPFQSMVSVD